MPGKPTAEELQARIAQLEAELSGLAKSSAQLAAENSRFQDFYDNAPDMFISADARTMRILNCNRVVLDRLGYTRDELLGRPIFELYTPECADYLMQHLRPLFLANKGLEDVEMELQRKDGSVLEISLSCSAVLDENGEILESRSVWRDITERKLSLKRTNRLNRLNEMLLRPAPLEARLNLITDEVVAIFEADFARIWMIRPGDLCDLGCPHAEVTEEPHVCRQRERCLHLVAGSGRYTHLDGGHQRVPFGCYKIGLLAAGQEPKFLTNDVLNDPRIHDQEWAASLGLVSFAGYRLLAADGGIIGVLALFRKRPITTDLDVQLENLAGTTAQVIQMAQAEDALGRSEEKHRNLVEAANMAIFTLGHDGRMLYLNTLAAEQLGGRPEDYLGRNIRDIFPPEVARRQLEGVREIIDTGQSRERETQTVLQGRMRWYRTLGQPLTDDQGRAHAAMFLGTDITESKEAEIALRESEAKYKILAENMADVIYKYDLKTERFLYASPSATRLFGYTPEEIQSLRAPDILTPESYATQTEDRLRALETGQLSNDIIELEVIHKDGRIIPMEINASLILDDQGVPVEALGVARDITERLEADRKLRHSEELFRDMVEKLPIPMTLGTAELKTEYANPMFTEVFGYTVEDLPNQKAWREKFFPDPAYRAEIAKEVDDWTESGENLLTLNRLYIDKWGKEHDVIVKVLKLKDRFYNVIEDVTERVRAERALRASEERLHAAIDAIDEGFVIYDAADRLAMYNSKYLDIYRESAEAMKIGAHFEDILRKGIKNGQYALEGQDPEKWIAERLARRRQARGSLEQRLGDGRVIKIAERRTRDGDMVGFRVDITELKRTEEQVKASLREKEVLIKEIHHRVKNNMAVVSSLLNLQSSREENPRVRQSLAESQQRIRAMALIHETLYQSSNLAEIDLSEYLNRLVANVINLFSDKSGRIEFRLRADGVGLEMNQAVPCGIIINELLTNSLKYGFPGESGGRVAVNIRKSDDSWIEMEVSDNGVGLPGGIAPESSETLGLRLISLMVEQLHGTLKVQPGPGTSYLIRWPGEEEKSA